MITLIAAVARNGVIGQGNTIPWHLPEDFKHFSRTTRGHIVIMGSRTWDSLPERFRPLPDRVNIVVSRDESRSAEGAIWCRDLDSAFEAANTHAQANALLANKPMETFVIGGASIYEQTIEAADRLIISHVAMEPDGDTLFPEIGSHWKIVSKQDFDGFEVIEYIK